MLGDAVLVLGSLVLGELDLLDLRSLFLREVEGRFADGGQRFTDATLLSGFVLARNALDRRDGVVGLKFKGGDAGKPSLQLAGKGAALPLPAPVSGSQYFDHDTEVIVQLHASIPDDCWSSTFGPLSAKKNDGIQFRAKTP